MLLEDRFVGSFGIVAAGDDELVVKVGVAAVRNRFAVVPMQFDTNLPACALTAAAAKKEPDHRCYHVFTEDTKLRTALTRMTKAKAGSDEKPRVGLAIDLAASEIGIAYDISQFWVGPPISPTLIGPDGEEIFVFDLSNGDIDHEDIITEGTLLVPPSQVKGKPVQLVGQMSSTSDNVQPENPLTEGTPVEEETVTENIWNDKDENTIALAGRIEALELQIGELNETIGKLQNALVVGLTAMKELRDAARSD